MNTTSIPLGSRDLLTSLYSYPNSTPQSPGDDLGSTIEYWFKSTLARDGFDVRGATATVRPGQGDGPWYLDLVSGSEDLAEQFALYSQVLQQYLANGHAANTNVVEQLKAQGKWDPDPDGPTPPYRPWRFFLPHGLAMLNQRSVQFFHYPPIRLLEGTRDYLDDPVPKRWEKLLVANGVAAAEVELYETVMDAAPIAAEDDQGSKRSTKGDKEWGLIPIDHFHEYQRAQMKLLVRAHPTRAGYTIPIVVYGAHPRDTFSELYNLQPKLAINRVATVSVVDNLKTPVLATHHPYDFYAAAQGFVTVGGGYISSQGCAEATGLMISDLAAARWQKRMAEDPSQNPQAVLDDSTAYWSADAQRATVCQQVRHHGSLYYKDRVSLAFEFRESMDQAAEFCTTYGNNPCSAAKPYDKY
jgi:hypothetical protein